MTTIRKLIARWMLALVGSLLLPLMSLAAVSGATYDVPSTTMTVPATIAEHTTAIETVSGGETSLRSVTSCQTRSIFGLSRIFIAPKTKVTKSTGRSGKQARLKQMADDPNVSSADRGWIKQEMNQIKRGTRKNIRVPKGKNMAHRRGFEAKKGYGYEHSDLQDIDLHKLQHKHEGY